LEKPSLKEVGRLDAMELNTAVCPQPLSDICSVIEENDLKILWLSV